MLSQSSYVNIAQYITHPISLIAYLCALISLYYISKNVNDRKKLSANPNAYKKTAERLNIDFNKIPESERANITLQVLKNRIKSQLISTISLIFGGLIVAYIVLHLLDSKALPEVKPEKINTKDSASNTRQDKIRQESQNFNPVSVKYSQPTIMVLPYTKVGEDIRTILENDFNKRIAITEVKEAFDLRGFSTVDFISKVKLTASDKEFNSNTQNDIKSMIVEASGADIYVEVEVPKFENSPQGNIARIILHAFDASTANSLANKVCESPRFITNDYGALVKKAIMSCSEDFLNILQQRFTDFLENGIEVKVTLRIDPNSNWKFSNTIMPENLPLSDVIEEWMEKNSFKNSYHLQGMTDILLFYDNVRIPVRNKNDGNLTPSKFSLSLYNFLLSKGIKSTKTTKQGSIFIIIT